MNKYIDAEKLKAEIERRNLSNRYITTEGYEQELYELIDSLQQEQPEVDLEKGIDDWYNTMGVPLSVDALKETARHFYELGRLNARNEK